MVPFKMLNNEQEDRDAKDRGNIHTVPPWASLQNWSATPASADPLTVCSWQHSSFTNIQNSQTNAT